MRSIQAIPAENPGGRRSRTPRTGRFYVLAWALFTALLVTVFITLNVAYANREVEREAAALERSAEYAAALLGTEIARLEENAQAVSQHRGFAIRTGLFLDGDESIGPFLQDRVESEVRARGYVCVKLLDASGTERFSAGTRDTGPDAPADSIAAAFDTAQVVRGPLDLDGGMPREIQWAVPLVPVEGEAPVAVVLMTSDIAPGAEKALALPGPWMSLAVGLTGDAAVPDADGAAITGVAPVEGTPWSVVVSVERGEVLRSASTISFIGVFAVVAVSVAFALGLVLLQRVVLQRDREYHANEILAERIKAEERFVAGMSHELRTPLNSIIGFARVLERGSVGPVNAEQRKQLGLVASAGKRMLALVNDLLDLSKARAGMTVPRPTTFFAADLVEHVSEITCPLSTEKGLQCSQSLPELPIELFSDRELLERILLNLGSNAIKFTPVGGSVTLEVREALENGMVEFAISDTGYGIEPDEMGRIMDEFFQGSSIPQEVRAAGTGLGLPISLRLARLLGGTIVYSSELGVGSRFVLRVPQRMPEPRRFEELEP